ncbi:MAG TPA: glycosyltransferase family 39 protein [Anaerolineae bacterium]|nr:glycosyltransferase family 39 protein [Anaerolineae bacterium]HQH37867.1 glycosyltransferase family 39 protein [Anaerolineae bacterium]
MKRLKPWERRSVLAMLLLAWGLRWAALLDVPPGWRDDDLIELYTFSQEILKSGPQLYFAGASGHEPLYHTIRAPLLALAGLNQASARWQAAVFGMLAVLLTWAVGRRLFTREVGLLAGALVAVSFWALMYSRVAIRHIGVLPWALLAIYSAWRVLQDEHPPRAAAWGMAIGTTGALYTYYAGRLIPALLIVAWPVVGGRQGRWKPYLAALTGGVLLAVPMFWAAAHIPGADARVGELAVPLRALQTGNWKPLLQTTWTTLGMAHATGDPEWLYNIAERPVFGLAGALLFYLGILTRLGHLKQANARWLLLWLGVGIAPAFISLPPSSYGHTILALPAVYILMAMPLKAAARRWPWTTIPLFALTLALVAGRDLPDYFVKWPQAPLVRFLYRADYRALAQYLDGHPTVEDAVVGSFLYGPWDKVAVETDMQRQDVALRWVNPERALVGGAEPLRFYVQDENKRAAQFQALLDAAPRLEAPAGMQGLWLSLPEPPAKALTVDIDGATLAERPFAGALALQAVAWNDDLTLTAWWTVVGDLPLPPQELIANPPPPGLYNGPRLSIFAHLVAADGTWVTGDDGLGVDPYSLRVGDRVVQVHHFTPPEDAPPGPYTLSMGLYDPLTGERWQLPNGADKFIMVGAARD